MSGYTVKDMFKQLEEIMKKCDNLSERDLRHVKIKQKVSGYFNSIDGIKIYLDIKSIIGTLKKQGRNFYNEIFNIYEKILVEIYQLGFLSNSFEERVDQGRPIHRLYIFKF